ncbi:MAG: arginine repressor [Eubacterium sp.]|jgi:transcriptional regulator of arginine metabolism|nr:arginine repressor [Eubacterium sp.]
MKKKRQEKIIEIINQYEVETQEDLARYLNEAGYSVTQATVSRDIREMSLVKVPGIRAKQRYMTAARGSGTSAGFGRQYASVLQDGVVSMEQAGNLLVIRTQSGMAMAAAAAIDAMKLEGIVGSIAGDDTIMCAVKTEEMVTHVMAELRQCIIQICD